MKFTKQLLTPIFFLLLINTASAQKNNFKADDLKSLSGCWEGNLTYLDYSSGKPYSMPAVIMVKPIAGTDDLSVSNIYPNEPKANSTDTLWLNSEQRTINKEAVQSRKIFDDGTLQVITEARGVDGNDNKKATFRYTYTIGKEIYTNKKEVRFNGTSTWITRHEYTFKRCKK